MDRRMKQNMLLIAFGVLLFAAVMNIGTVITYLGKIIGLSVPVAAGFIVAFVLNVPMSGVEKLLHKLFAMRGKQPKERLITAMSLSITLVVLLLVLYLVGKMLIPQLASSVVSLYAIVMARVPQLVALLNEYNIDISWLIGWLESLDVGHLIQNVTTGAGSIISSAVSIATSAVSLVTNTVIALIIAFYTLWSKKDLARQANMVARAYLKEPIADYLIHTATLMKDLYSKFFSGQCVEACILGLLMVIALSIFRVPYAVLIGVLAAVGTLIPYVGSVASCGIGAFLVLLVDPSRVILCVVVYLVVQFVENQFIYPYVVGTSVGLSALWTLVAVLVGGKLMGLLGVIFFIPLTAVVVTLLREHMQQRLAKKQKNQPVGEKTEEV